jgi:type V secretory pathway adhesin AidA
MIINPDISLNGALSAVATLMNLGYTFHGGEQWKPPLGAMPVQEPVAWVCYGAPGKRDIDFDEADIDGLPIGTLLYTTPPEAQRQWVGLTDAEEDAAFEQSMAVRPKDASNKETRGLYAQAIEAKLREKNSTSSPAIPDALTRADCEGPEYTSGWNDCRAEMLKGMK